MHPLLGHNWGFTGQFLCKTMTADGGYSRRCACPGQKWEGGGPVRLAIKSTYILCKTKNWGGTWTSMPVSPPFPLGSPCPFGGPASPFGGPPSPFGGDHRRAVAGQRKLEAIGFHRRPAS